MYLAGYSAFSFVDHLFDKFRIMGGVYYQNCRNVNVSKGDCSMATNRYRSKATIVTATVEESLSGF